MAKQQKETRSGHETDIHLDFEKPERDVSNSELRSSTGLTIEQDDSLSDGISQVKPIDLETSVDEIIYEAASDDDSDAPLDIDSFLAALPETDEDGEALIDMETEESEVKEDFSSFPSYVCFYWNLYFYQTALI